MAQKDYINLVKEKEEQARFREWLLRTVKVPCTSWYGRKKLSYPIESSHYKR
jgi:hypothetical protein